MQEDSSSSSESSSDSDSESEPDEAVTRPTLTIVTPRRGVAVEAVNDQTVPQATVTPPRGVAVPSYYSKFATERLLDKDHAKYEGMLSRFVSELIFADMKFCVECEEYEVKLCLLAINKGFVKLNDRMIRDRAFAEHFHPLINKSLTRFRNKANVNARRRFVSKSNADK